LKSSRRIRLLAVIPSLEIGGAERQMCLLLQGLEGKDYDLALACCRLEGPILSEVPASVEGFDLHKGCRWDFPWLVHRLRKVVLSFQPDVILASTEYANLLSCLATRFTSRPAKLVARKETMASQAHWGERMRRIKLRIDRSVDRRADLIIAPSEGILQELRYELGTSVCPMVHIPNGVDVSRVVFYENESRESAGGETRVIVAMGRLVAMKGFDLLLEAVALLPRGALRLKLVGDGPERHALETLAQRLGIPEAVQFMGRCEDPFPHLRDTWFGVVPSAFEGFGNVIIEMFAAGLPVIAFDVDYGPREIIRHGVNGLLVSRRTAEDLAEKMVSLLGDSSKRDHLAAGARRDAEGIYNLPLVTQTYDQCFRDLAAMP